MKKKVNSKKKGPKGKKARAKAKLEKQWGEQIDEAERKASKFRRGKSRLLSEPLDKSSDSEKKRVDFENDINYESSETRRTALEEDYDSDHTDVDESDAFSELLNSIEKKASQSNALSEEDEMKIGREEIEKCEEERMVNDSENETEDDAMEEDDFEDKILDPFTIHFSREPLPENDGAILDVLKEAQSLKKINIKSINESLEVQISSNILKNFGLELEHGSTLNEDIWNRVAAGLFKYNRKVLRDNWRNFNQGALRANCEGSFSKQRKLCQLSNLQTTLYPAIASYADMLLMAETLENRDALNNVVSLHLLNHILTCRGRILRNNKVIKEAEDASDIAAKDQGYTRPSVLIILPTRGVCHSFLSSMIRLLDDASVVENMDRFDEEYGPEQIDDTEEGKSINARRKAVLESKGREWNSLFADEVNSDDDFKLGVALSPKAVKEVEKGSKSGISVKLYSDFYKSDIIVASPLALKAAVGQEDDEEHDIDYLSSIEICFIANSDILLMQNWDNVKDVFTSVNKQPENNNDTDFSRVREYLLAGQAKHWRQLIVFSKFSDPSILSTFKNNAASIAGVMKLRRRVLTHEASLVDVIVPTKQVFQRVPCDSFSLQGQSRLDYFKKHVLSQIQRSNQKHTMIFVPSYFEFVSLRNLMLKENESFVSVTEYARVSEVSRGRARFLQGKL